MDPRVRCGLVLMLFVSLTSCFGDGGSGPGGSTTLLQESFSAAGGGASVLTDKWEVASSAICSASNTDGDVLGSPPQGNPTYGLVLKCTGAITGVADYSSLRTIDTYVLDRPHTFAADARVDAVGTFGGNPQPGMDFSVEALNNGYLYATVWIRQNVVTYYIRTGSGPAAVQVTRTHAVDALFHRYEFEVDGNGKAEWRRDGALQASTNVFYYPSPDVLTLRMRAPPSTAAQASEGHFDNVLITQR